MPRIPVRTEPYTSPARQQRHYKNKRDQMLRTLGKASYINGSHFAILLVSAKGEVETFASELLKPCLSSWFNGNVVEEARNLATRARTMQQQQAQIEKQAETSPASSLPILTFPPVEEEGDMTLEDLPESPSPSRDGSPFSLNGQANNLLRPMLPSRSQSLRVAPKLAALDMDAANMLKYRSNSASYAPSPTSSVPTVSPNPVGPGMQTLIIPMNQLDAWYTDKMHALQQTTCKLVAKCWIKVIEPKKQTKHPYNLGEEGKPIWWPKGLQHREPDHLLKPERTQLLLSILRSPLILVSRLELSTAEQNHLIPPERIVILRELYKVAREDEKRRRGEVPADQDIVVQVPAPPPHTGPRMPWPGDENYSAEMNFNGKRPRLSDPENDGQPWPYNMPTEVGPLGERINGVPSPALSGQLNQCMSGLGQPIEMVHPGEGPFLYAPPPWPNTNPTLQLPPGDFYFHASPASDISRPVSAHTFESGPSRPLTANTSLESDVSDDRMQFPNALGNSLTVPHLLHRSHSFPGSAHPQIDMNFGGASPLAYSQQAPTFALNDNMTAPSSQAEPPNPFGFAPSNQPRNQFNFNMHDAPFQDSSASFEAPNPSSSLTASPDSWTSPQEERSQNRIQIMPMALHLDPTHASAKDSPSMGMMQWLNDSVHGTPAVDSLASSVALQHTEVA
ncbi:hypothetical protein DACRYDRAFT_99183 [Dacryopinax primogenitus]|uniref:Subtelomeric hrmA-associated cluster protein AFUB-079030/YDR124W-like helical bundle domain-containing protein n=1 Tax=Dacryopinax primogenitus (strain DJM 731) TaxID=1858805 RepID=M5G5T3_DACPD|nr:uncharacterized protein DACRYDRAFT_99183 [Dacryopinax primogenitus]EJU03575.1 hypothetical protein DACRYDRAFT_99183 [Dacryopinax primogenitus]